MVWCLFAPAVLCGTLGVLALTLDLRTLPTPRLSLRMALRGCISGTLILLAGCLVALASVLQAWLS